MLSTTYSILDTSELKQLAMEAASANDMGAAIAYLKELTSRPDADGVSHFLLGAYYAQIKLYDRATNEMESALALDPGLSIARFQLGLLWLTGGFADKALTVFAPLDELPETDCLRSFGAGLRHLAQDNFDEAKACLKKGIELNTTNPLLNVDMQSMVDGIDKALAANETQGAAEKQPAESATTLTDDTAFQRQLLLSAYAHTKTQ
jgi:tetratricopeptide (TPR) repeat protein